VRLCSSRAWARWDPKLGPDEDGDSGCDALARRHAVADLVAPGALEHHAVGETIPVARTCRIDAFSVYGGVDVQLAGLTLAANDGLSEVP
jgi:hypothetical protein